APYSSACTRLALASFLVATNSVLPVFLPRSRMSRLTTAISPKITCAASRRPCAACFHFRHKEINDPKNPKAFVPTGTNLQLHFSANAWSDRAEDRVPTREFVNFDREPGK
ncbi:hypothetical protein BaRGS_00008460, partial [Batillaria attramentaria]